MYENNLAKQYFSTKGTVKAVVALKVISAVLIITLIILALASGSSNLGFSLLGGVRGIGTIATGMVMLYFLPLFILIGMAIVWAVSLSRSSSPESDGSLLRSSAAASLALSSVGFFALLGLILMLIGSISTASGFSSFSSSSMDGVLIASLILSCIGFLALLPTAISRMVFYRSVQKSMNSDRYTANGASLYAITKIINAVVKAGFGVVMIILITKMNGAAASIIITFVCAAVAFFIGAAGNIVEAKLASDYKKSAPVAPANVSGYPYQAPENPTYGYSAPAYPQTPPEGNGYNPYVSSAPPTCPNCGSPVNPGSPFCGHCGTKL